MFYAAICFDDLVIKHNFVIFVYACSFISVMDFVFGEATLVENKQWNVYLGNH